MKVWVNQNAAGTTSDSQVPATWEVYANTKEVSFSTQGTNYVHALFMDEVGNVSAVVDSTATIYDSVAPVISAVSIDGGADYTNDEDGSVVVRVTVADVTSAVDYVTLSGDIQETGSEAVFTFDSTDLTNGYKDCNVTLTTGDGVKTIAATATDLAGNTSVSSSDSITYDTTAQAVLVLRTADDTANLGNVINTAEFAAAITASDSDIVAYKIYGDIVGATTEPADFTAATFVDDRFLIDNLEFTSTEGTKTVYVKAQDAAGNIITLTQTAIMDTTAPTVGLTADVTTISAQTGYNTVTFTYTASDTNGLANYTLKLGEITLAQGAFTNNMTEAITASDLLSASAGEGTKDVTLYVTDVAGNEGYSSDVTITVDLTAPTGSVSASSYYNTTSIELTVAATDTGGAALSYMKVWLTEEPSEWSAYAAGTQTFVSVVEG